MWGLVQLYIYMASAWGSRSNSEGKIYPCLRVCPVSNVKGQLCWRSCNVLTNGSFSGWVRAPLIVWDVNMGTLSPLPRVRPLAAACGLPYCSVTAPHNTKPGLSTFCSLQIIFIHVLDYIFRYFFRYFSEYCFKTKWKIFSAFKSLSNFVGEVISYCSYFVVTVAHTDF